MRPALRVIRAVWRTFPPRSWAIFAVLAAFLIFGAYCAHRGAQGVRDGQAAETLKIERKAAGAAATAADERLADLKTNTQLEKELTDAVSSLPDARPSDRRVALACQRLRHQRTREADLPPVCRPAG